MSTPGGNIYKLLHECMPPHEGEVSILSNIYYYFGFIKYDLILFIYYKGYKFYSTNK